MIVILILASLGILDAGYLSYVHLLGGQSCGQWLGCSYVLSSPNSRIFGVPLSTLGLGVYLCMAFLATRARDTQKMADAVRWIFYITLTGNLLTVYLIYLQASVIQHWCPFCLLSMILMFSIFVLTLYYRTVNKGFILLLRVPNWNYGPKFMSIFLILPSVIFLGMEQTIGVISTNSLMQDSEIVARIGDQEFTLGEVNHGARLNLNLIEWKRYEARLFWLENKLLEMEANRQGITVKQLKKKNIDDAISVSEEEIQKYYKSYQKQLVRIPYIKVKGKISEYLKAEKKGLIRQEFLSQLKQRYNASFSLPKPLPLNLNDNPRQGPEKGPVEASLTVIIFTDFECPFCAKAYQQIKDLLGHYPQDVRIVFRHFPLDMHKNAHNAAYAAACAHLQGKFWPYADLLFKNQGKLALPKLYDYADQAGLDMEVFRQCMEYGRGKEIVDADVAEGLELGLNSTPVLFFNGHSVKGFPKPKQIQPILDQYLPKSDNQEVQN
jgi:protein-disulfide isomerase/uncharacterized membrane protein